MSAWRLLLTRPADESEALAQTLRAQSIYSAGFPLLAIEPAPIGPAQRALIQALERYSAVIVVSKPAARLCLDLIDEQWPRLPSLNWFTVGAASAAILQARGLEVATPSGGDDSEALLQLPLLAMALQGPAPQVLIVRGEGGREVLAHALREQGARVDYLELYRRTLPLYAPSALAERIQAERLNGLVVSSGQGLQHLLQVAGDGWPALAGLTLFVPSARVAAQAEAAGARRVVNCQGASAQALLAALAESEP